MKDFSWPMLENYYDMIMYNLKKMNFSIQCSLNRSLMGDQCDSMHRIRKEE